MQHPFSWVIAYVYAATFHQFRREPQLAKEYAQRAIAICREHNFNYYLGWAMIINGWTNSATGNCNDGISEIHEGLEILRATGGKRSLPYYTALLAESYWMNGQNEPGLQWLNDALTLAEQIGEPWWTAEIYRLRGDMFLNHSEENTEQAEASYMTAIKIATDQKSLALQLRTATSLYRLWHNQGKKVKAHKLLSECIARHTEGIESHDYKEAQELLRKSDD